MDTLPLVVRPLCPEDRDRYRRAVDGLSPTTVQLRFGGPRPRLSDAEVDAFLDVGREGREAVVATDPGGEIVGVARFAPSHEDPEAVEAAVVVADRWQGRGVGTALVDRLVPLAPRDGFRRVRATSLVENHAVAAVLRSHGFRPLVASYGVIEWVLELS
jgi:RimJ/RimL family protein N-acetyltransferase